MLEVNKKVFELINFLEKLHGRIEVVEMLQTNFCQKTLINTGRLKRPQWNLLLKICYMLDISVYDVFNIDDFFKKEGVKKIDQEYCELFRNRLKKK